MGWLTCLSLPCTALDAGRTAVQVSYTLTALNAVGERFIASAPHR